MHVLSKELKPKAARPTSGSADLCFITQSPLEDVKVHLQAKSISIIEGPVKRTGAVKPLLSIYVRDPDGNLIEIANEIN